MFNGNINSNDFERRYNMTEFIKPNEMICLALRYLTSGETFRLLEFEFLIKKKTISGIVIDVCRAIFEILGLRYVNTPRNTRKWLKIVRYSTNDETFRMVSVLSMENSAV